MGKRDYDCSPWGAPAYNVFGWQKPCYLLQDGYVKTFTELLKTTNWSDYGTKSGNAKCSNCMVSCGYEPSAVSETFGTIQGFLAAARATLFHKYRDGKAMESLMAWPKNGASSGLIQISETKH